MEWSLFGLRCREVGPVELRGSCLYNLALRDINTESDNTLYIRVLLPRSRILTASSNRRDPKALALLVNSGVWNDTPT